MLVYDGVLLKSVERQLDYLRNRCRYFIEVSIPADKIREIKNWADNVRPAIVSDYTLEIAPNKVDFHAVGYDSCDSFNSNFLQDHVGFLAFVKHSEMHQFIDKFGEFITNDRPFKQTIF